jgi:phospholipid/cholesterol/gamma-HCH transport system substrate-binding protein
VSRNVSQAQRIAPSLVKLGLFIAVTLTAFSLLALTIANVRFGPKADYAAMFTDATGLNAGDDVRIAGVRVGEVTDVRVAGTEGEERSMARVSFRIEREVVLTEGTTALIRYRNLIGQRYLALSQEQGGARQLPLGSTIPRERTQPALDLTALFNGFKPLFAALNPEEVNKLAYEIITVLQGEGGTIEHLLASTASLTSELADRDEVIGRTIDNLNVVLGTVSERSEQLDELIVQLQRFVSGLAQDREAIGASLTNIADLADSTAGLVEQARPPLQADVRGLGDLATLLDANQADVQTFLDTWPGKIETLTRTATYGSWFNFYLCDFRGQVVLPAGGAPQPVHYDVNTARCGS